MPNSLSTYNEWYIQGISTSFCGHSPWWYSCFFTKHGGAHLPSPISSCQAAWAWPLCPKCQKCEFDPTSIEFLGYIISPTSITMDMKKVSIIGDWATPSQLKDVQSFLGFTNFYRRRIKGFSTLAQPLISLTREGTPSNKHSTLSLCFYMPTPEDPSRSKPMPRTSPLAPSYPKKTTPT